MRLIGHSVSDGHGTILTMDAAVCDMLQRARREIIGLSYLELTHPVDRRRNATLVDDLPCGATPITFRKRYTTPDGQSVEADVHLSRLKDDVGGSRLIGTLYHVEAKNARFAPAILWKAAKRLTEVNEVRRDMLGSDLFCDHATSILLQLYLDEAEGKRSDIRTVATAVGLNLANALRWLRSLEAKEMIEFVGGDAMAQLTGIGMQKMLRLLKTSAVN